MSIYKECDIRGIYGKELTPDLAYLIGRAIGSMMAGGNLAVGGDIRISTPVLKSKLIGGLMDSGANVVDLGMVPTPVFYYALTHIGVEGGVTVTASHNPPEYNGFKLVLGDLPVTPEIIEEIKKRVEDKNFTNGTGKYSKTDVLESYKKSLLDTFHTGTLKVVIDCGNGAMSEIAPFIFKKLGYDVYPLFCEYDGTFPNRSPNPAVYDNLKKLCTVVRSENANLGIAFDGDGDRVVFVDDSGRVVNSERSLVLFIYEYLKNDKGSVVYDIKSSSVVKNAITEMGGIPLMERSGHAFIRRRFLENKSVLAGEISGHFFFRELGYDDGLYAALTMAEIIQKSDTKLSVLVNNITAPLITPDIRIPCSYAERDQWLDAIGRIGEEYHVNRLDGVRIEFPDGWLLARKSVTEEGITIRIEGMNQDVIRRIKDQLITVLPPLEPYLNDR